MCYNHIALTPQRATGSRPIAAVGQVLLMRPVGATTWERVLVADCSGDLESMNWMLDNNIIAELDYGLFMRWAAEYGLPLAVEMRPIGVRYYVMRWVA